jgi:outer membrane protein OmpA-like peptidoglycan-associated protein
MAHATGSHGSSAEHPVHAEAADDRSGGAVTAFLLAVATTAVTLWALLMPRPELPASLRTVSAGASSAVAAGEAAPGLGALVERSLPGGAKVAVPERGIEGHLLAFIADAGRQPDKATWFDFDRLTFETGAATLRPESRDQLAAVAAILAAYPGVKLKLGGYTDNVGDPASNMRLSEQRAQNVRAALAGLGVAADRLTAEGYGEQFPVGDNATAEGRARNRRISMRVTEK